jgi:hypothetical protein
VDAADRPPHWQLQVKLHGHAEGGEFTNSACLAYNISSDTMAAAESCSQGVGRLVVAVVDKVR